MKKFLKILMVLVLALCCAASVVACAPEGGDSTAPGLHYKKMNDGTYTVYKYVAEDSVDTLDLGEELGADITSVRIKKNAFKGNNTIKTLIIPETVTEIEQGAFAGMKSLETLVVPFVGKNANADAYIGETGKEVDKSVDAERTIAHFFSEEKYDAGAKVVINYNSTSSASVYVPTTLRTVKVKTSAEYSIPTYAFSGAVNLTEIVLEGNVVGVGEAAFKDCKEITEIALPASVQIIYKNAFNGCQKLSSLDLSDVTALTVLEGAFVDTSLDRSVLDGVVEGINDSVRQEIFG